MDKKIIQRVGNFPQNKGDLAQLYSKHVCRKSALRLLNSYIHRHLGFLNPRLIRRGFQNPHAHLQWIDKSTATEDLSCLY